jgi:hypothetical protein
MKMVENNYEERDDESQEEQVTWIAHNMATNQVWEYFWRSKHKIKKTNRCFAMCKFCDKEMEEKPQRIFG